jgi:hypothetical protein
MPVNEKLQKLLNESESYAEGRRKAGDAQFRMFQVAYGDRHETHANKLQDRLDKYKAEGKDKKIIELAKEVIDDVFEDGIDEKSDYYNEFREKGTDVKAAEDIIKKGINQLKEWKKLLYKQSGYKNLQNEAANLSLANQQKALRQGINDGFQQMNQQFQTWYKENKDNPELHEEYEVYRLECHDEGSNLRSFKDWMMAKFSGEDLMNESANSLEKAHEDARNHSLNVSNNGKSLITKDKKGIYHVMAWLDDDTDLVDGEEVIARYRDGKRVRAYESFDESVKPKTLPHIIEDELRKNPKLAKKIAKDQHITGSIDWSNNNTAASDIVDLVFKDMWKNGDDGEKEAENMWNDYKKMFNESAGAPVTLEKDVLVTLSKKNTGTYTFKAGTVVSYREEDGKVWMSDGKVEGHTPRIRDVKHDGRWINLGISEMESWKDQL